MKAKVEEAEAEVGTDTKAVIEALVEVKELVVHIHRRGTVTTVVEQAIQRMIVEHSRRKETNYFVVIVIPMVMMKVHVLN